ncbi:MAG: FGGY family carbohydrate kinase [Hyphomicrobiales bacterium]
MPRDNPIVLGLDQGTTNVKAIALDARGIVLAEAVQPIATQSPSAGIVEQDAETIYATAVACTRDVISKCGRPVQDIVALGIANQTETLIVWDRATGKPVMPAMIWQDRRGAEEIASLRDKAEMIRSRTGLDLDPTFTAAKLRWVFRNRPEIADGLKNGSLLFGTVDTWLIWKLTVGATYATDASNASRTMLFDIARLAWDPELVALFDLTLPTLPECRASKGDFGSINSALFGAAIPIRGVMGDQQASLFGHGCFAEGELKITYGTGAFLWVNAGERPPETDAKGIIRTVAWQTDKPCYAFEGFVMYAGKIVDWLATRLAIEDSAAGVIAAAEKAGNDDGILLIPAFQGLASPWWQPSMRAAFLGLSEATSPGNLAQAGLEAIAFQIRAILDALEGGVKNRSTIKIDGGLTRAKYFLELQANLLGRPLAQAQAGSVTPFGAALMAGLGASLWPSLDELRKLIPQGNKIEAVPDQALEARYGAWRDAIRMMVDRQ